jgi:Tol biopolymer transport system component
MKKFLCVLACITLSACAGITTAPAHAPTPGAVETAALEDETPTPGITSTPRPSSTPTFLAPIGTDEDPMGLLTQEADVAQATKFARFSMNCNDLPTNKAIFSPNENWLAVSCGYNHDQTLEIANRDGQRWVLQFKDFLPKEEVIIGQGPMGGLYPVRWSNDEQYLYFTSDIAYDGGGTCFYGFGSTGLFRIQLKDGATSAILPILPSMVGYELSFSPSGRRLAYQGTRGLILRDLQTGSELTITSENNTAIGDLAWSPDGSELAYAVCQSIRDGNDFSVKKSAVKIFSIRQQASRTVLEMEKNFLSIDGWEANNVLRISIMDEKYDTYEQLFDVSSGQWITPTPTP